MSFSYSKQDIDDVRESPALDVIELLRQNGADVRYDDPSPWIAEQVRKARVGK